MWNNNNQCLASTGRPPRDSVWFQITAIKQILQTGESDNLGRVSQCAFNLYLLYYTVVH